MTDPLRLEAPAKLNLSLRVVDREDGYHLLESELVLLELADRLLLLPGCSGLRIEGTASEELPLDDRNLAWRGLRAGVGADPDLVCLAVEKRIAVAAGLGGGSSDAAAAWRLGRAWRGAAEATAREVEELVRIGADVPFFASRLPAARVTGIGERVTPASPIDTNVLLVHPPFALSTADVFAELRPDEWGSAENDLLAPARRLRPELDELFATVRGAGATPRLTGSGPTIFALDDDRDRLAVVGRRLADAGIRVTMTRTRTSPPDIERIDEEE